MGSEDPRATWMEGKMGCPQSQPCHKQVWSFQHKEHSAILCPSPRMEVAQAPNPISFFLKVLVKQGHLGQVPVCLCKVHLVV